MRHFTSHPHLETPGTAGQSRPTGAWPYVLGRSEISALGELGLALAVILAAGCTSQRGAQLAAKKAFMAGQQQAWAQYQQLRPNTVRMVGPVRNPAIDWREDLTLVQAIIQAHYELPGEPRLITVLRGQERVQFTARQLLNGQDIPVAAGDVVELTP